MEAAQLAAAHARLQRRMEDDPSVTTMQPGGVTNMPAPAYVNGAGGKRLTPDTIAQRSRMAQGLMASGMDTSPVGHWTQGAARVAQALVGSLQQRGLDKAADANAAETDSIAKLLMQGGKGMDPTAYDAALMGSSVNQYADPSVRALAASERERIARENAPEYFMSGDDRVRFDRKTGQSSVVYDAPEEFETYAAAMGYKPGTPEYNTAAQDYVLRSSGPTANGFDVRLEEERQQNRVDLEGERQRNRLGLRGTPTYGDLHPKPRAASAGGGGGGGSRPSSGRAPTMAGTMAPILAKVARGETLTPAEQQAWTMYRPARGGRQPSVAGALVGSGNRGGGGLPRPASREDFAKLPKGARFIDPRGTVRVK